MPKPKTSYVKFGQSRRAWVTTAQRSITLYITDEGMPEHDEPNYDDGMGKFEAGPNMKLVINTTGRKVPLNISLTAMTADELHALKTLLDMAFTTALPVCRQRDQDAEEAANAGITSYPRLYRSVPELFVRQGSEYRNSTRVRSGLDWPADLDEYPTQVIGDHTLRGGGSNVPERDPIITSPKDYVSEANDLPYVRLLGWVPDSSRGVQATEASEGDAEGSAGGDVGREEDDRVCLDEGEEGAGDPVQPDGDAHLGGPVHPSVGLPLPPPR